MEFFSGGGVKAFVFIGALKALEEENISFERVAGTSAGALFATLVAAGFRAKELEELFLTLELKQFLDQSRIGSIFPFIKWLTLYQTMGLYRGDVFQQWLEEVLREKGIQSFQDLNPHQLKIVAADISINRVIVFPDDLEESYQIDPSFFSIAKAVRSSISIPYFFRPSKLIHPLSNQKSLLVDGMILSNFPLWVFDQPNRKRERPILGMQLSSPQHLNHLTTIHNSLDLLKAMIVTMRTSYDNRYISENVAKEILFFPIEDVQATDFDLSRSEKVSIIEYGYQQTKQFLSSWTY